MENKGEKLFEQKERRGRLHIIYDYCHSSFAVLITKEKLSNIKVTNFVFINVMINYFVYKKLKSKPKIDTKMASNDVLGFHLVSISWNKLCYL